MIVLASASPRRRALLEEAGLEFTVEPSDVDETLAPGVDPVAGALELATRKARATLLRRSRAGSEAGEAWLIGADTIVAVPDEEASGWTMLGKPADASEARRMLGRLSGTRHLVVTGVCVLAGRGETVRARAERTWVTLRELTEEEIETYVASGEWRDKAGGYAIQENADAFVSRLEGGFDNVVGLPVPLTLELLRDAGAPVAGLLGAPATSPPLAPPESEG